MFFQNLEEFRPEGTAEPRTWLLRNRGQPLQLEVARLAARARFALQMPDRGHVLRVALAPGALGLLPAQIPLELAATGQAKDLAHLARALQQESLVRRARQRFAGGLLDQGLQFPSRGGRV